MEAVGGAHLSPGTFPDQPHALLPTHISLQKKSQDLVWPVVCGHHYTCFLEFRTPVGDVSDV